MGKDSCGGHFNLITRKRQSTFIRILSFTPLVCLLFKLGTLLYFPDYMNQMWKCVLHFWLTMIVMANHGSRYNLWINQIKSLLITKSWDTDVSFLETTVARQLVMSTEVRPGCWVSPPMEHGTVWIEHVWLSANQRGCNTGLSVLGWRQ